MLSRRKFLQANMASLALPVAGSRLQAAELEKSPQRPLPALTPAQAETPLTAAAAKRDYWNDWPLYLTAKMNEARARRKAALESVRSQAQMQERITWVRAKVWEFIGGSLEKTPLNARMTGTIERKTYRIEKVVFESQPQVYVTAHLYVPGVGRPPFPGILAPLGHTRNGKAYRNYQYVYQTLARKGYVVLAFDPFGQGERLQYLDPRTGQSRYGPTGEHSQAGRPLLLLGATFAQYRVWDGIRALDYLLSRPEVDPHLIGCTGHSGGGTMTMYLAALEPRIQVAVEVQGNSENLAGPHYDPPGAVADAEQNLVGSLPLGIDRGDLLAAFAPKPLLVCYTPLDTGTTYSPVYAEASQEILEELKHAYTLMGAREKVDLFVSPLPHDFDFFTRRATYEWFNRWLGKADAGSNEDEFDLSPAGSLNCTSTGQVLTSLGGRSVLQLNIDRARLVAPLEASARLQSGLSDSRPAVREGIRSRLQDLLALPLKRSPLQAALLSSNTRQGQTMEEFEFRSEPQIRVPGWLVKPSEARGPFPTVLYLSGKNRVVEEPSEADVFARRGFAVCAIDLRGTGISTPRYPAAGPLFYGGEHLEAGYAWASLALGAPVLGQRVWDVLRCLDYLEGRSDVDSSRIHILGVAGDGLAALMGAVLDDRPQSILLDRVIADLRSVVESEEYSLSLSWLVFGILREFDLPDLVAALVPRPCWLFNAMSPRGEPLPESMLDIRYKSTVNSYRNTGGNDKLQIIVRPDQERSDTYTAWLRTS